MERGRKSRGFKGFSGVRKSGRLESEPDTPPTWRAGQIISNIS